MKKDMTSHHQYQHYQTPNIQICNGNNSTRLISKANLANPVSIKNVRSSSLPLKIISNSNRLTSPINRSNSNSNHVRSWTDFSFLNKQRNNFDCFNFNGLYFNYKYRQISRSERFLDFIEFRDQTDEYNNFNSNSSISSSSSSPSTLCSDYSNQINKFSKDSKLMEEDEEDEDKAESISSNSSSSSSSPNEDLSLTPTEIILESKSESNVESEPIEEAIISILKESTSITELVNNIEGNYNTVTEVNSDENNIISSESNVIANDLNNEDKIENDTTINESISNLIESTRLDNCDLIENDRKNDDDDENDNGLLDKEQDTDRNEINDTLISSATDLFENEEELSYKNFIPKKSCLKSRISINELSSSDYSSGISTEGGSTNATSSPLISPSSPSYNNSSSLWSTNESGSTCNSTTSSKKRVLFADDAGKELFTVRTMSEPSNCPPKLTSKIVEYFLNREFSNQNNGSNKPFTNEFNNYATNLPVNNQFFSSTRSYDYGISALNYTNDVNKVSGSLAVYSLNFQQPAGDYLKFRQRIEQKCVSLENVLLNGFQVNGTIKVKNINFHKNVFIRCSFDKWATHEDYKALFVPCDYFSSTSSSPTISSSSSISASFCGSNNSQPIHKEFDTFRFEFQLPKTVDQTKFYDSNRNITASIQFCICYETGQGGEKREYWDNNDGLNYEFLQYVIDLERLKPNQQVSISSAATAASTQIRAKQKSNFFKFESNNNKNFTSSLIAQESGIYY